MTDQERIDGLSRFLREAMGAMARFEGCCYVCIHGMGGRCQTDVPAQLPNGACTGFDWNGYDRGLSDFLPPLIEAR